MKTGIPGDENWKARAKDALEKTAQAVACAALLLMLLPAQPALGERYSYDPVGRLTAVAFDDGSSIAYEYDNAGNITRISRAPGALPPDGRIDTPDTDVTIEAGQSVDFTSTVSDPDNALPLVIRWDFDGAAPDSDEEDPGLVFFDTPGSYNVELNVTDATGLADPTPATRVVTVNAPAALPPEGTIDSPANDVTIEAGQGVVFESTVADPDGAVPLTIRWDFDGAAADSNVEDPGEITFANAGTYTVQLNVTDADGLSDPTPATRIITVQAAGGSGSGNGGGNNGGGSGAGSFGPLGLLAALVLVLARRNGVRAALLQRPTQPRRRDPGPRNRMLETASGLVLAAVIFGALLPAVASAQSQWIRLDVGTGVDLNDVWGTAADNVFVVGAGGTILHFDGNIWTPMDSGTVEDLNAVHGYGPDEVYAVGANQTFLRFDGSSWTPFAGPAEAVTAFVDVWTAGPGELLWVLSGRRAWYWDGTAWTVRSFSTNLNASLTPNAEMRGIGGTPAATIVVSRPTIGTDQVDGGLFANFRHISEYDTRGVYAASDADIFAVGRNSYRFQGDNVRNAGQWRPISIMREAYDAWGTSSANVYAVGTGVLTGGGQISHYDGNGTNTWTKVYELPLFVLKSIWGASEADIFVVGNGGVVLRYAEAEAPQTAANFPNSGWAGDFVNGHTGELVLEQVDFAFNACFPFEFSRYHASGLTPAGQAGGSLGPNWSHSFEWQILHDADTATITTWRGRTLEFARGATGWESTDPYDEGYALLEDATAGTLILVDEDSERLYVFDANLDRLARIEDRFGNRITIQYSIATGKPTFISDGKGLAIQLIYGLDELASIRTGVEGAYRDVVFEYTDGRLTSVTDPEQARTEFLYDSPVSDRLITAVRMPEGNIPYTWTYGSDSRVASQADAFANTSTIAYQSGTSPTSMQAPDGSDIRLQHDDNGQLVGMTNGEGETVSMAYDGFGRVTSITEPTGVLTTLAYDGVTGRLSKHARSGQGETLFSHTVVSSLLAHDFYDVSRIDQADGTSIRIEHNAAGLRSAVVDQKQNRWTYGYDATGNLVSAGLPSGAGFTVERDSRCNADAVTDSAGNLTGYTYDRYNRLVAVLHPDTSRRIMSYDDDGRMISMTNERGKTMTRAFDGNGNVISVSIPGMPDVTYTYDEMDRVREVRSPKAAVTSFGYDSVGRLRQVSGPLQAPLTVGYDGADRAISLKAGDRAPWQVNLSPEGLPDDFVVPGMAAIDLGSTGREPGRVDSVSDGATAVVKIYDGLGRFAGYDDGAGKEILRVEYDERGNITAFSGYGGLVRTEVEYNALGRPTVFRDANGNDWLRGYDTAGRLTRLEDPLGRFSEFAYDSRSRLRTVVYPSAMGQLTVTRNASGRPTLKDYSDGTSLAYTHDDLGRLVSANGLALAYDDNGKLRDSNGIAVDHDAEDRVETVELAPGKVVRYHYDDRGALVSVEDWLGQAMTFSNDVAGMLGGITRANGIDTVLDYDPAGRLVLIETAGVSRIALEFDADGRVAGATRSVPKPAGLVDAGTSAYSFDPASQAEQFSHDGLGRRIADSQRTYRWNLASRLLDYVENGTTVAFDYDAMGSRIFRSDTGGTREYVWNYALELPSVSIERQDGQDLRYYVHTPAGDLLYSVEPDGERRFYHYDERGNTLYITGNGGSVLASYAYSPYGEVLAEQGGIENPFTFMGQRGVMREGDSDLYYVRARYYDAGTGRFLSRDAEKSFSPKRGNPYQYARGNPMMFSDPTGLSETEDKGWFSALQRKVKSWWNDNEDEVNAGFDALSVVDETAGSPWEALASTVSKKFDQVVKPAMQEVEGLLGLRQRLGDRGKLSVFHNKNIREQISRLDATITRSQGLRSKLLSGLGFLDQGVGALGTLATVFSEDAGLYTRTAYGKIAGKLSVTAVDAWYGRNPAIAVFTGASSLVDYATEQAGQHFLGMEGIKSGSHEVLYAPVRIVVAAGEDFFTEPRSNRDSALYKLSQTMKSTEAKLGAATFGLYELGESLDEKLGISDGIAKYIFGVDEE